MHRTYAFAHLPVLIVILSITAYLRADRQQFISSDAIFTLVSSRVSLHEPIYVEVVLNNSSAHAISADLGDNWKGAYRFTITPPDGRKENIPPLIKKGEGIAGSGKFSIGSGEVYRQLLLVNEWYEFSKVGKYVIELELPITLTSAVGEKHTVTGKLKAELDVTAKDIQRLDAVCNEIMRRALTADSVQEATDAAMALTYIPDPAAVPYLEQLLRANRIFDHIALLGLGKIGDSRAVQALLSAMDMEDKETATIAAQKLYDLKNKVSDPILRGRVEQSLKNFAASINK